MDERIEDERRLVELFAKHGAEKMAKRRHHGRWLDSYALDLLRATQDEAGELQVEYMRMHHYNATAESMRRQKQATIDECVDVALTAMMLADKLMQEGCE